MESTSATIGNGHFPFSLELFPFHLNESDLEKKEKVTDLKDISKQENFNCEYSDCHKLFKSKKSLRDHLRIHKGEKPYTCFLTSCLRKFTQYSSLQKHERIHKGEKPYICDLDQCNQAFSQISNLKRHHRTHTKERPYLCENCTKTFTTTSNLKQHQQIHSREDQRQKYQCQDCDKAYYYSSSLKKHKKDHKANEENSFNNEEDGDEEEKSQKPESIEKLDPFLEMRRLNWKHQTSGHICIIHRNHLDILINGYLYNYSQDGQVNIHEIEVSVDNPDRCEPLEEINHFRSMKELENTYREIVRRTSNQIPYELLISLTNCNAINCRCSKKDGVCCCNGLSEGKTVEIEGCSEKHCSNENNKITYTTPDPPKFNSNLESYKIPAPKLDIKTEFQCCKKEKDVDKGYEMLLSKECCQIKVQTEEKKYCFCSLTQEYKHRHGPTCGHLQIVHNGHFDYIVGTTLHFPHNGHCDDHGRIIFYG